MVGSQVELLMLLGSLVEQFCSLDTLDLCGSHSLLGSKIVRRVNRVVGLCLCGHEGDRVRGRFGRLYLRMRKDFFQRGFLESAPQSGGIR